MGIVYSFFRNTYIDLRAVIVTFSEISSHYSDAASRISAAPGFPVPNPTAAFWQSDPPYPSLVGHRSKELASSTDIVIIGSGITGASIAYTILSECTSRKITMLEARNCTSGATGRNGGHIKCSLYQEFSALKSRIGVEKTKKILDFQMKNLEILVALAKEEDWSSAEARYVETVDFFLDSAIWEEAKSMVQETQKGCPDLASDMKIWEGEMAREMFKAEHILGAITYKAGALWPYRMVTSCLSSLLSSHSSVFSLETNTPAESITVGSDSAFPFLVCTPRGTISAKHVVHATDAYTSTLVPGFVGKIFPVRGTMTAQRPGNSLPDLNGTRSWGFVVEKGYDYVTQRPGKRDARPGNEGAELMIGGGLRLSPPIGLGEIGVARDDVINHHIGSYLGGVLPMVFGNANWGRDAPDGRVKSMWTGIMGFSADGMPFVGKLDPKFTKRYLKGRVIEKSERGKGSEPAEWIAAGYGGDGMPQAWLCGVALALMILGKENEDVTARPGRPGGRLQEWFPEELIASKERISKANNNELIDDL